MNFSHQCVGGALVPCLSTLQHLTQWFIWLKQKSFWSESGRRFQFLYLCYGAGQRKRKCCHFCEVVFCYFGGVFVWFGCFSSVRFGLEFCYFITFFLINISPFFSFPRNADLTDACCLALTGFLPEICTEMYL